MKRLCFFLVFTLIAATCFGGHIAGGELFYKYLGAGSAPNTSKYQITLRLFRECNPPISPGGQPAAQLPGSLQIAIFNNTSPSTQYGNKITVAVSGGISSLTLGTPNPCIVGAVTICYQVANYVFTQELPNTPNGYIVMYQTCCRTTLIGNVQQFSLSTGQKGEGATYVCEIPGTTTLANADNASAVFALKDTTLVCKQTPFALDFSATDADGDSLSYSFCPAYDRGFTESSADPNYSSPPFTSVTYTPGFSGSQPLGPNVSINPTKGIISGIAPDPGYYVVNVCITEWRNGKAISFHRKDFTLRVTDCSITAAALKPTYVTCNGTTLSFQNESTNANVTSYLWDFGVPNSTTDTSTSPTPTYDYLKSGKDSGTYTVKLKVTSSTGCIDSASSVVKVYPGFTAGFRVTGTCFLNSYFFSDTSKTKYGFITSRTWDFGDRTSTADTAHAKDSAWKYPAPATVQVKLTVANNVGCIDTVTRSVTIVGKPTLQLPFRDTLICSIDTLALRVNTGSGTVQWTASNGPNRLRILNSNTSSPLVFPKDTTKYYVAVNDNGCANTDSVTVNVLPFITVKAGTDTGICRTDSFYLHPTSDALSYVWRASTGETVAPVKYPQVKPLTNTRYYVTANLGRCQARDSVAVKVAAYPSAAAGTSVTICYGSRVQLSGSVTGSVFAWSPTTSLINERTLNPIAGPTKTTAYVLSATDTIGCPKPKTDTIVVTVIPPIRAYAGNDTVAVPNEPLQLTATGGSGYLWSPSSFLSDPAIANPVALFDKTIDSITYTVRVSEGSCYSTDHITVRIYKNGPDILVPSGFTPNGDGRNDLIRPVLIGISRFNFFSVYNRWGQLIFTTHEVNKGWDGNFNGVAQPGGTYVYQAQGADYQGKPIFRKGTVVLVR